MQLAFELVGMAYIMITAGLYHSDIIMISIINQYSSIKSLVFNSYSIFKQNYGENIMYIFSEMKN